MREEQAVSQVQLADALHILVTQREVEHIEVLLHTLLADGLRDDNHAALDEVAQGGLCRTLVVFRTDGYQRFVAEEVVASLGKRSPRHNMCAVLLHNLLRLYLLVEHVGFHLIDHWRYLAELRQVDESVGIEIRHADGSELARLIRFHHRSPRTVIVVERLVNEQQVDVVGLQFAERLVDACLCPLVSGALEIHTFVTMNNSSRGTPQLRIALPTFCSLP